MYIFIPDFILGSFPPQINSKLIVFVWVRVSNLINIILWIFERLEWSRTTGYGSFLEMGKWAMCVLKKNRNSLVCLFFFLLSLFSCCCCYCLFFLWCGLMEDIRCQMGRQLIGFQLFFSSLFWSFGLFQGVVINYCHLIEFWHFMERGDNLNFVCVFFAFEPISSAQWIVKIWKPAKGIIIWVFKL